MNLEYITTNPIDLNACLYRAHHAKAGAIVLFSGEVRNHHEGSSVEFLEYEAHKEMAEIAMETILKEASEKWELHYSEAIHRIGKINIKESAVVVITSASHRDAAYEANKYIIDRIKAEVPIWKKEYYTNGKELWK